jgi:hypothetical protein|tara:strand:+ start:339 stop:527 length:189 start_codon:yes stop_codon:yes gene_type:complete
MLDKIFKVISGLIFIVISLLLLTRQTWYTSVMTLLRGGFILLIIILGLVLTFWGLSELKSEA